MAPNLSCLRTAAAKTRGRLRNPAPGSLVPAAPAPPCGPALVSGAGEAGRGTCGCSELSRETWVNSLVLNWLFINKSRTMPSIHHGQRALILRDLSDRPSSGVRVNQPAAAGAKNHTEPKSGSFPPFSSTSQNTAKAFYKQR